VLPWSWDEVHPPVAPLPRPAATPRPADRTGHDRKGILPQRRHGKRRCNAPAALVTPAARPAGPGARPGSHAKHRDDYRAPGKARPVLSSTAGKTFLELPRASLKGVGRSPCLNVPGVMVPNIAEIGGIEALQECVKAISDTIDSGLIVAAARARKFAPRSRDKARDALRGATGPPSVLYSSYDNHMNSPTGSCSPLCAIPGSLASLDNSRESLDSMSIRAGQGMFWRCL
jgi:hypothetical protein